MAADPIQSELTAWHLHQDRRALGRAFEHLRREWAATIACFLCLPISAPEVEDCLSDLLVTLLGADRAGGAQAAPRALAPEGHGNPAAYRALVLRNALRDRWRREQARQRALLAAARAQPPPPTTDQPAPWEEALALRERRQEVLRALPRIEIRRRVALALALDVALPARWLEDLAQALVELPDALVARLRATEEDPEDLDRRVRVLYPTPPKQQARDAFRKTVERAVADLRPLLHRGQA